MKWKGVKMNLNDVLNNYKTTPENEMRKIEEMLSARSFYYDGMMTLIEILREEFLSSDYKKYETTFDSFYSNVILCDSNFVGLNTLEKKLTSLIMYEEFLLNLLLRGKIHNYHASVTKAAAHLISIISEGLAKMGYEIEDNEGEYYIKKIDAIAEIAATNNPTFSRDIFDYLVSKTVKNKEDALLNLSNRLNAIKECPGYVKQNKEYVQLLRHKDEKIKDPKYAWFYNESSYNDNLDKLFKIFISMISYCDAFGVIEEFDTNCGREK